MTEIETGNIDKHSETDDNIDYDKIVELFEKRFKIQEQTLTTILGMNLGLKDKGPNDLKVWANMAGFINIISYDLKVITRDMIVAKDEWQKRHYARQSCLIIYESINDLFELLGKDFKRLLRTMQNNDLQLKIKKNRSDLNQFKDDYQKYLYTIRNTSIAHRDKEALKQLATIIHIDWNTIIRITLKFEEILQDLEKTLQIFGQELMKIHDKNKELKME